MHLIAKHERKDEDECVNITTMTKYVRCRAEQDGKIILYKVRQCQKERN